VPVMEDEMTQPLVDHFCPPLPGCISQQVEFQHCGSSERKNNLKHAAIMCSFLTMQGKFDHMRWCIKL
jgi:hypothetical protein